jgi:hypothetical protein
VLSAKYGFVRPEFEIPGSYEVTFKQRKTEPVGDDMLRQQVKELRLDRYDSVIGLGGADYRHAIEAAFEPFKVPLSFPFAGLPIGKMMRVVKQAIAEGHPTPDHGGPTESELPALAKLIRARNEIDNEIAGVGGRPPHPGHIAEYVAAAIFDIELHPSASTKTHDGNFREGPLAGKTVNVKYGSRRDGMLNLAASMDVADHADYYLVLTGPLATTFTSVGLKAPWVIDAVYLFASSEVLDCLKSLDRRAGTATSIRKHLWEAAMVYPEANNPSFVATDDQRNGLELFRGYDRSSEKSEAA